MDLLLDTHSFIWFVENDTQLTVEARNTIENHSNDIYISIAGLWEMAIKISLGKLQISISFETLLIKLIDLGFKILPITTEHILVLSKLEFHHRDPFDRLLICQSKVENIPIVSKDDIFDSYDIHRLW
jgi:PIN domain nuclease of toxin-antitoxin system